SPIHHVHHSEPKALHACAPLRHRLVTPIVALSIVLSPAPNVTKPTTSSSRSSAVWNPALRSSPAPTNASRVLPTAIPAAVARVSCAVTLATNAPRARPGQTRGPRRRTAARAIPVGGHTGLT